MKGTIKKGSDIDHLFSTGKRVKAKGMLLLIEERKPNRDHLDGRVAFIAGKKLGNAPMRSRAKRLMRHVAAELGAPWGGMDVAFVANHFIFEPEFEELVKGCRRALEREGLHMSEQKTESGSR